MIEIVSYLLRNKDMKLLMPLALLLLPHKYPRHFVETDANLGHGISRIPSQDYQDCYALSQSVLCDRNSSTVLSSSCLVDVDDFHFEAIHLEQAVPIIFSNEFCDACGPACFLFPPCIEAFSIC